MPYSLERLLGAVQTGFGDNREYRLMRDVISLDSAPKGAVVLRFDVERGLGHHLRVATRLADAGIRSSMYFHTRREAYDARTLRSIQDLGHEVGYHHECLDRCGGDFDAARQLFLREVELFRGDGLEVSTVCGHGEAGLPKRGYRTNRDLFTKFPGLLAEAGLAGEVYEWLRDESPLYASDTFRSYGGFWDVLREATTNSEPVMVLVHLHRWRGNPATMSFEVSRDLARQLTNRVRGKRGYEVEN